MAIGDYLTMRNTTDTTSIPENFGTLVTAVYDTTAGSSGSGISYSAGTFTVSAAGKYLVGYSDQAGTTDTTNNERNQIITWIQVEGVDAPYYGWDAGYIRKASGSQEEIMSGVAILDLAAADTFKIVIQRSDDSTVGTVNRVTDRSGIYVISLDTALNYGRYRGTLTAPSSVNDGVVTLDLNTTDEQDSPFTLASNEVDLATTNPVLYCYSIRAANHSDTTRSEYQSRVQLAGAVKAGSYDQCYARGSDNTDCCGMSVSGLVYPSSGDNFLVELVTRDDGDITADFDTNLQLVELPAATQAVIAEATSGDMNPTTAADFAWDTYPHVDTATFTTGTAGQTWINVDVAGDYLAMASLAVTTYEGVQRAVPAISFRVQDVQDDSFGATAYNRGNGTAGFAAVATSGLLTGLSADDDIELYTDRVGTQTGALIVGSGAMSILQLSSIMPSATATGFKHYNGTAFADAPVKYWNGSAWITAGSGKLKHWNGSAWAALN